MLPFHLCPVEITQLLWALGVWRLWRQRPRVPARLPLPSDRLRRVRP